MAQDGDEPRSTDMIIETQRREASTPQSGQREEKKESKPVDPGQNENEVHMKRDSVIKEERGEDGNELERETLREEGRKRFEEWKRKRHTWEEVNNQSLLLEFNLFEEQQEEIAREEREKEMGDWEIIAAEPSSQQLRPMESINDIGPAVRSLEGQKEGALCAIEEESGMPSSR